jgi:hypothetical protein
MITDFDKILPAGLLFPLRKIDEMDLIKTDMAKKLINNGQIEVTRIGNKLHISRTELIRYLTENTTERSA